jgi:cytochrome c-type biogenesis protein CcmH/NrfG
MMMNRERIGFWVRLVSVLLAVFFVGSFIFMGLGTNVNYNLFDLIGGSDQQQGRQGADQTQQQIEQAEKELEENPKDPEAIKTLAALYFQENRLDDTVRVLEEGREAAPKDAEIPIFLGQVYSQQAQATPGDEQKRRLRRKRRRESTTKPATPTRRRRRSSRRTRTLTCWRGRLTIRQASRPRP